MIVQAVAARPVSERSILLKEFCGTDVDLREAEALLQAYDDTGDVLPEPLVVGTHFGAYRVERELARGGMGAVFLAHRADDSYQKLVAIKLISAPYVDDSLRVRFIQERQILAGLEHPGIARLIDGGTLPDGREYIVIEYVDGVPITEYADRARLSVAERISLMRTVCASVSYAHQKLVIHRDLKPGNILVTADGQPKLLDFGIAKLLTSGGSEASRLTLPMQTPGTPAYASPEQREGRQVDTSSDVFALGVILHELLVGCLPVRLSPADDRCQPPSQLVSPSASEVAASGDRLSGVAAARHATVPDLHRALTGDLDAIVARCLATDARERYASPSDLSDDLRRHLAHVPISARPRTAVYVGSAFVRRNRAGVAAATALFVAVSGGFAGTYWQWQRAESERARAERRFDGVRAAAGSLLDASTALSGADPDAARRALVAGSQRYLDGLERNSSGDHALLLEVAAGYRRLGDVQRPVAGRPADSGAALAAYRRAVAVSEQVSKQAPGTPTVQREVAQGYERVGSLLVETGQANEGSQNLQQSLRLYEQLLSADRTSAGAQRDLMLAHLRYADATAPSDAQAAARSYEESRQLAELLVRRDPQNAQAVRDRAMIAERMRVAGLETDVVSTAGAGEARFYEAIRDSQSPERLAYFLERFPDSPNAAAVRQRLADVTRRRPVGPTLSASPEPLPRALPTSPPQATVSIAAEWKPIPGGRYAMGCDLRPDRVCREDERPRHWTAISSAFQLMATEVTVSQYHHYADSGGKSIPPQPLRNTGEGMPVVNVTWDEAARFCEAVGGRLPTEAEWEWAARGGRRDTVYPWGDDYDRTRANSGFPGRDGWDTAAPAATFPPNGYGVFDMAGNVWEWVADWYAPTYYQSAPETDPRGAASGTSHVLRGGSYATAPAYLRVTQRGFDLMDRKREATGFRCAR